MNSTCARWSDRYLGANLWFIPADPLKQAPCARTRSENVVNAALLAATAGPFHALAYHLLGFDAAAIEILPCCACMLASPLLLGASGSIRAARELFLCALFFNFTWLSHNLGGIGATGVHNRRYLISLIEKEKERSDRNGRVFCLCLLDIDFFKRINDTR